MDAEYLFSPDLEKVMIDKGVPIRGHLRTIWNWRQAGDERGLKERQRSKYNYALYNMILDELMQWHKKYEWKSTHFVNNMKFEHHCLHNNNNVSPFYLLLTQLTKYFVPKKMQLQLSSCHYELSEHLAKPPSQCIQFVSTVHLRNT